MRSLMGKYIDGELTEDEAAAFLASVDKDPELEAELRSWEAMLKMTASAGTGVAPTGLTDDVMARVRAAAPAASQRSRPSWAWQTWLPRMAWAAGLAVIFVLGRFTAQVPVGGGPDGFVEPVALASAEVPVTLRAVRLVFVPDDPAIDVVTVAGTFNGWSTSATQMERRGDVFVAQVVLPPGSYEYMFVVDGENWVTDPLAMLTRDDGFGRENAVLDVTL